MKILKNLFAGFLVGIANVIPGLSGGTLLVLTNTFAQRFIILKPY